MPKTTKSNPQASTQNSLLISEIKDGVVVLKDGSLRAVIMASAINFDLMSQQEQTGTEYAYQGFLNSLHFPIQITVKSQKIDLDSYIEDLEKKHTAQDNQLLAMLMEDYIANVKALVEEVNIMDKQFYVVIPFFPSVVSKTGFFANLGNLFKSTPTITVSESEFAQYKTELTNRVQLVTSGLNQMGIRAIPLNTQELVELYYTAYNPDVAPSQKLINHADLQGAAVMQGYKPTPSPAAVVPAAQPPVAEPASYQPSQPYQGGSEATAPVGAAIGADSLPVAQDVSSGIPQGAVTEESQNVIQQTPTAPPDISSQPPMPGQQFQPAPQPTPAPVPPASDIPPAPDLEPTSQDVQQPISQPAQPAMPPNPLENQQ